MGATCEIRRLGMDDWGLAIDEATADEQAICAVPPGAGTRRALFCTAESARRHAGFRAGDGPALLRA